MGATSKIEWTDASWSPVTGCTKVSPGCNHCYAERIDKRWGRDFSQVVIHPDRLEQPFHWKKPRRIFTCSMSDLFHGKVPWKYLCQVFEVMTRAEAHTFQILTKRPGRMAYFDTHVWRGRDWRVDLNDTFTRRLNQWPSNVWVGTSVESAKYLPRLDVLARVPAKVRFLSAEPLLGPLNIRPWLYCSMCGNSDHFGRASCPNCGRTWPAQRDRRGRLIDWVIVGGESGPGARPMEIAWVRSIRDQCVAAGVPFFYKQAIIDGKRTGTPELDGRTWKEFPDAV